MTEPASEKRLNWRNLGLPLYLALVILIVFAVFFVFVLLTFDDGSSEARSATADAYRAEVDAVLANADPARGEPLLTTYTCTACHRAGVESGIAPGFVGLAQTAAERRPPMPADAYLYESIVYPGAYVVEGYPNSMPHDLAGRMTEQELGDIIAYLLTEDAQ